MEDLARSLRQPPGSAEGASLAAWLRAVERTGDGWGALFEALMPLCDRVAREFPDVMSADEARAACMGLAYERSVGAWLDGVARAAMSKPFGTHVGDQLRDHLRALRRTRARRDAKDRALTGHDARAPEGDGDRGDGPPSRAPPPDSATHLRELLERLDAHPDLDGRDRRILGMLAHGHEQKEIARVEGVSEPTISRAVARVRAAIAGLIHPDTEPR